VVFIVVLIAIALVLSSRTVRVAVPFESFVVLGVVAVAAMTLYQFGKLG
jgi:hypothetical protein